MATRRTTKKKKNGIPIWVWTGLSALVLTGIIAVLINNKFNPGPTDQPTSASSPSNLVKQTLPNDLPTLIEFQSAGGSVSDLFRAVADVQTIMRAGGFEKEKAEASTDIVAALKSAAKTSMPKNLLDKRIPAKRFDDPELTKNLQALTTAIKVYIKNQNRAFQFASAREAAYAQVLLGKQMFENNTRLKTRMSGLAVMRSGLNHLSTIERAAYDDAAIDQDELTQRNQDIKKWMDARKAIQDQWGIKLKAIESKPNPLDIKKIALEDEDPTFRVFAARRMGFVLYERGEPGNQRFIKQAIKELSNSNDQAVAEAAKDGASVTREEYHDLLQ